MIYYYTEGLHENSNCPLNERKFVLIGCDPGNDLVMHSEIVSSRMLQTILEQPYFTALYIGPENDGFADILLDDKQFTAASPDGEEKNLLEPENEQQSFIAPNGSGAEFRFVSSAANITQTTRSMLLDWLGPKDLTKLEYTPKVLADKDTLHDYLTNNLLKIKRLLFTDSIDDRKVILGYYEQAADGEHDLYLTAKEIFENDAALRRLQGALQTKLTGYCKEKDSGIMVYAIAPTSLDDVLETSDECVTAVFGSEHPILSATELLQEGIPLAELVAGLKSCSIKSFETVEGDVALLERINTTSVPKIYYVSDQEQKYIFAAFINDTWISLKDIIYLQTAYDAVEEAIGAHIGGELQGAGNPTCRLIIPENAQHLVDACEIPQELRERLREDYEDITVHGIQISTSLADDYAQSDGCVLKADGLTLSRISTVMGDAQARKTYTSLYNELYPEMSVKAQEAPTADIECVLPSYQTLKRVYNRSYEAALSQTEDAEDDENATAQQAAGNNTNYFGEAAEQTEVSMLDNSSYLTYDDLDMQIDNSRIHLSSIYKFYDCSSLRESLKVTKAGVDPILIEGNPANDTLGIQENELRLYTGLRSLMLEGICRENSVYTLERLNELLAAGVSSTLVDKLLRDMVDDAYSINWAHTGHVMEATMPDQDDDSTESVIITFPGRYRVELGPSRNFIKVPVDVAIDNTTGLPAVMINGMDRIKMYAGSHVTNSLCWVEILIRVLRWGARKPAMLSVPSQTKRMFLDMQSLEVYEYSSSANGKQPNEYQVGDQHTVYRVYGAISSDVPAANLEDIKTCFGADVGVGSYPCGVLLATTFKDTPRVRFTPIDVFSLATLIESGSLAVLGITYEPGVGFSCTDSGIQVPMIEDAEVVLENDMVQTEEYSSSSCFDLESAESLGTVLGLLKSPTSNCKAYASKLLIKYASLLSGVFPDVSMRECTVFDILRCISARFDTEVMSKCVQLLESAMLSKDDTKTLMRDLKMGYGMYEEDIFIQTLFFHIVGPIYSRLFERLSNNPSLAEMLNCALAVLRDFEANKSRATRTTTLPDFSSVAGNCKVYFQFVDNTPGGSGEPVFFGGLPKDEQLKRMVLWAPGEYTPAEGIQILTKSVTDLIKSCIQPHADSWQPMMKQATATPTAKSRYLSMLNSNFIMPSVDTYTKALQKASDVLKRVKRG